MGRTWEIKIFIFILVCTDSCISNFVLARQVLTNHHTKTRPVAPCVSHKKIVKEEWYSYKTHYYYMNLFGVTRTTDTQILNSLLFAAQIQIPNKYLDYLGCGYKGQVLLEIMVE